MPMFSGMAAAVAPQGNLPDSPPSPEDPPVVFYCGSCGTRLTVPHALAGQSGPCPCCKAWVASPLVGKVVSVPASQARLQADGSRKPLPGVLPDANVDRADLEHREMMKILWIIAAFILVGSAILGVTWFLEDWRSR